jgi:hypothetical protein
MFILDLFSWWYGSGWFGVLAATRRRLRGLAEAFSINILLHTLFAPWKRIITYPGAGVEAKVRAIADNLVSRFVGFTVRFIVLLSAAVSFVGLCLVGLAELIVWPLLPLLAIALIVKGVLQ